MEFYPNQKLLNWYFFKKVHNSDSNPAKCQIPSTIAEGGVQES